MLTLNRSLIVALTALLAASGCESSSAPAPAPTGSAAAPVTAAATGVAKAKPGKHAKDGKHRGDKGRKRGRRGGPHMMVKLAMKTLELTDEQRGKLEALGPDKPSDEAMEARKAAHKALADAVRAGAIDVDALMKSAPDNQHEAMVTRLDTLHATLTPEQRTALVATMRDKGDRKKGDRKRGKGDHAHEHEHEGGEAHDHGHGHGKGSDHDHDHEGEDHAHEHEHEGGEAHDHGHDHGEGSDHDHDHRRGGKMGGRRSPLGKMLHGIELSEEQTTKVEEALAAAKLGSDHEDGGSGKGARKKEEHEALLEAFTKDDFDAAKLLGEPEGNKHRRYLERLAVVVPLLEEEQRNQLAERIEAGKGGKRGRKRGPRGE